MSIYRVKRNDTKPLEAVLTDRRGIVNLTGCTITFAMKQQNGSKSVTGSAAIVDAAKGEVRYDWAPTDLDTPGLFDAEFEVTFGDDTVQTFPNENYLLIDVQKDIAP